MKEEEFVRRIKESTGLRHTAEAERAARVVLEVLTESISPDEGQDLASQLPGSFKEFVFSRAGVPTRIKPDMQTFVNGVMRDLHITSRPQAEQITLGVFGVLREAITPGEMEDVVGELPPELRRVVQPA